MTTSLSRTSLSRWSRLSLGVVASLFISAAPTLAQGQLGDPPRAFTAEDYARAERFMSYNVTPLVFRATQRINGLPSDRFWYRVTTPEGSEFVMVEAEKGTRAPAFDHSKLAAALS